MLKKIIPITMAILISTGAIQAFASENESQNYDNINDFYENYEDDNFVSDSSP